MLSPKDRTGQGGEDGGLSRGKGKRRQKGREEDIGYGEEVRRREEVRGDDRGEKEGTTAKAMKEMRGR